MDPENITQAETVIPNPTFHTDPSHILFLHPSDNPNNILVSEPLNGTVQLTPTLQITNVLHVLDFQFNLLSVHKLCKQIAGQVTFTSSECTIQGPILQEMVLGKVNRGLYHVQHAESGHLKNARRSLVVQNNSQQDFAPSLQFSVIESSHWRLGHLSFDRMKQLELPCNQEKSNMICSVCPKARLHRQSFPLSNTRASKFFDLIHVDIWGSYKHNTYDAFKYFLTIIDDHSRATWVHLMSSKSNAFPLLQSFIMFAKSQFDATVKTVRSDWPGIPRLYSSSILCKTWHYTSKIMC